MKKIKVLALVLAAIMLVGTFASCAHGDRRLIGKWVEIDEYGEEGDTYTFARNGKGSVSGDGMSGDMTWSVSKGILTVTMSVCGMSETKEFRYKISGKTMTWIDVNDEDDVTTLKKK